MPRASVIVPIYNVGALLDECLASACTQTLSDLEIVCVDDGSTDDSGARADAWSSRDGRIRVLHKQNGGLSSARNAGVDAARGEFLYFLDADDALEPDALERICAAFDRSDADVVTFGATCFPDAPTPWLERCLSPRAVTYDAFDPAILLDEASTPFAWRTACRRSWLLSSGVRFDEGIRYGEDTAWHFALYPAASKVALVPDKVYRYRLNRSGSLMDSQAKGSAERIASHVDVAEHVFAWWESAGLVDRWGAELVGWCIAYVLYATLRQPADVRAAQLPRLRAILERHVEPRMDTLRLHHSERDMVRLALSVGADGSSSWGSAREKIVCLAWRLHRYGLADLIQTMMGRGGSKSGSGE